MKIHESAENYLETILVLSRTLPAVRSIDIVEHIGYSKPSVSRAVGILKNGNYIKIIGETDMSGNHVSYTASIKMNFNKKK